MHGRIEGGALASDDLPPLRLRPAPGFEYRGSCELEIAGVALAARHHFLDEGSSRLLVVQLEHFTAPDRSYSFEMPDPVELGGDPYTRLALELRVAQEIAENPGREMETTMAHLERRAFACPTVMRSPASRASAGPSNATRSSSSSTSTARARRWTGSSTGR
jgi:hypothetical protein